MNLKSTIGTWFQICWTANCFSISNFFSRALQVCAKVGDITVMLFKQNTAHM